MGRALWGQARGWRALWGRRLPVAGVALVAATVAAGLAAQALLPVREFGSYLGVPLPPFFWFWSPAAGPWALVAGVLLAAGAAYAPRLRSPTVGPALFAVTSLVLALALRLALGAARQGPSGWYDIFATGPDSEKEYLPALAAVEVGALSFLDRFAEVAPSLPIHPSAHPPGMLLLLHALGVESGPGMAALTIAVGVGVVPLTYLLGRRLLDEGRARTAALLVSFAPSALLYGVSSADALYATLGLACAVLLLSRRRLARALGGAALWLASLFAYSLLAIGAWAALLVARRDGLAAGARLAATSALALVAGHAVLYAVTGFDPLGALAAADLVYRTGIFESRPYAYWLFGSPAAFVVALGPPIAWYWLQGVAARRPEALALAGVVVVAAVLGYTKAETERIWLFMVPLACVAAAAVVPERRLGAALGLLAAQALAVELLFDTLW